MPLNIDLLQILLHALNFAILAGGLTFLLFRPVNKFLNERKAYFEQQNKENAEKKSEAEAMYAEYQEKLKKASEESENIKAEAEREMASVAKSYLDEAKEKASGIISAAEKEAETRKEHILDSAQAEISELVLTATQKLLSDTVSPERNSELYDEFIRLAENSVADKRAKK